MPPQLAAAAQLAVAALGGLAFHLLGLPAPWLSGAVVAVSIWGAIGFSGAMPRPLVDAALLMSGVVLGAGVTPQALAAMGDYPFSIMALLTTLVAIPAAAGFWLVRVSGWQRDDAILATVPGALSTVFAIAAERGVDVAPIAVAQSVRFLALVALLPSAVVAVGGEEETILSMAEAVASPLALGVMLIGGLALGLVFQRLRIMAALLLGGTIVSGVLHVTEVAPGAVPDAIATIAFVLIGAYVAERFHTLRWEILVRTLPAAFGAFAVAMGVSVLFAGLAAAVSGIAFAPALVAFAPGGLEAMLVLALALGIDPLYVGTHHLARVLVLGFGLPLVMTWLMRGKPQESKPNA